MGVPEPHTCTDPKLKLETVLPDFAKCETVQRDTEIRQGEL